MSAENLSRAKRSFSFHNHPHQDRNMKPLIIAKPKKKLFQKSRTMRPVKKFSVDLPKRSKKFLRPQKHFSAKGFQLPTPHNTTQFIVDAVYCPTDPYIYEYDMSRFEYDLQHHAMSGSMMKLMQERLNSEETKESPRNDYQQQEQEQDEVQSNKIEEELLSGFEAPKLRLVKSADDSQNMTYDSDDGLNLNYDQLLIEAKSEKDLQEVIKGLMDVIKKKDTQISTLMLNYPTQKKEFLQVI